MSEVQVVAQPTPNPNSVKFTVSRAVTAGSSQTFASADEAGDHPLGSAIFGVDGVTMVFLLNNFVTVSKDAGADWDDIVPRVQELIEQHFAD